jgi:hypothetical protein
VVDLHFERQEDLRRPLHLVNDHALWKPRHEAGGIFLRGAPGRIIIKVQVRESKAFANLLRKRRLAALPRTVDEYHRRVRKGFGQGAFGKPRQWGVV